MDTLSVFTCLLIVCKHSFVLCDENTNHNVFYQGFGDLILICNGSDVINITGVNLINHHTVCNHYTCTLSPNDKLSIETCNNNSTCKVPVHDMSGCITQKGFYNVRYTCNINALTCDFDNNNCQIQHINDKDKDKWIIVAANTVGDGYRGHTLHFLTGRLMVIKDGQSGETKLTNRVYSSPKQCLSFYYWGNNLIGYLTVFRELENGSIDKVDQFAAYWRWEIITRNLKNIGDYYLRFKATGSGSSQFLVDDIRILNADCDESRDRIEFHQTCRKVDDITELQSCSKYYIENVTSQFDPIEEKCRSLLNDQKKICNESGDSIHCDFRPVVNSNPSCFNLNTLRISYTCNEAEVSVGEVEQKKNDAINIGLVAGAVSGAFIVFLIFAVIFIICRYHRQQKECTTTMQNQSVLWNLNTKKRSSQAQPNRLESVNSPSLYTDANRPRSDSEHKYITISPEYEAIIETPNDYTNNSIPGHEDDNQLGDNYNTLDQNSIGIPNVYDDLASPSYTDTNNDTANENEYKEPVQGENVDDNQVLDNYTILDPNGRLNPTVYNVLVLPSNTKTNDDFVNDYEEPMPGEYADCIDGEYDYEQIG